MSLNKVMLIGSVGSIEVKSFDGQNGTKKCATFSLATNERYKDRNGNLVTNTEWHNIVSWNHAEVCEKYVQKGSPLFIEGKLRTRSYDDQHGNKRYVTEILAEKIDLLGKKDNNQQQSQQNQTPVQQPQAPAQQQRSQQPPYHPMYQSQPLPPAGEPSDDDLPFD